MTPEQYDRWKDFALRMARQAFPTATEARRARIVESINEFFSWYDDTDVSEIGGWDDGPSHIGDEVNNHLSSHQHYRYNEKIGEEVERGNRFANQVSCCIRAGLDRAVAPSGGVLGFTVGDLRRMYPEGLPDWVIDGYEPPITAETPDEAGVWL
jgi:hypothetical protein